MASLLGGLDPEAPDFAASLNRRLLASFVADGDSSGARADLVAYVALYDDLVDRFGSNSVFNPSDKKDLKHFRDLAQRLGYKVKGKGAKTTLIPIEADDAAFSRRVAQALDIDLHALVADLAAGRQLRISQTAESIDSGGLGSLKDWSAWTGESVTERSALVVLAADHRLSRLLEGRRRLDTTTQSTIPTEFWRRADDQAAAAFYRYSASLQPCGDKLCVPGGESARLGWERLLGTPPTISLDFVDTLFGSKKSRFAHLWNGLAFEPDDLAAVYTASRTKRDSLLRKISKRLDEASLTGLEASRGTGTEFDTLVRATPVDIEAESLELPGGPGLWFIAAKVDSIPTDLSELRSDVERARKKSMPDDEYILKVLTETTERRSYKAPVLERLIPALGFFSEAPHLATPEAVLLVTRTADAFEPLIQALARFRLEDPEVIVDTILAAAHLDREAELSGSDNRLLAFQSGVAWLAAAAGTATVAPSLLEERLHRWARIHLDRTPDEPTAILDWTAESLTQFAADLELQPVDPDAALAGSLVPLSPDTFTWRGLSYRAADPSGARSRFQEAFSRLGVASPASVVEIAAHRDGLAEACTVQNPRGAHEHADALGDLLRRLPTWAPDKANVDRSLRRELAVPEPSRLLRALERVTKADKGGKLERTCSRVWEEFVELDPHLTNFLLAISYARLLTDDAAQIGSVENLVHRHQLQGAVGGAHSDGPRWQSAKLEPGEETGLGGRFVGSPLTLSEQAGKLAADASLAADIVHDAIWRSSFLRTPWHRIGADLTRRVAAIMGVGRETAELARGDDQMADFLRDRIPAWRVERWLVGESFALSPSDLWTLGLAAVFGDEFSPPLENIDVPPDLLGVQLADLRLAGAASVWTNGRGRPWVGPLAPYEALDRQRLPKALAEREWLDLKLRVLDFLGSQELPGALVPELLRPLLYQAHELPRTDLADWESFIHWLHGRDDEVLAELLTEWLKTGAYRLDM